MKIKIYVILLFILLSCENKNKDYLKSDTVSEIEKPISSSLYDFVLSKSYVLNPDVSPTKSILIEFIKTRNDDTLFVLSSCPKDYYIKDKGYIGFIETDKFKLFIYDKDKIAKKYYDFKFIHTEFVELKTNERESVVFLGMIKNEKFFEIFYKTIDSNAIKLFQFYLEPTP